MFQEIKDYLIGILKSRLLPLVTVFVVLNIILIHRLFTLQIIEGEQYRSSISSSIESTKSIASTRGNIYDCNGVLLAHNELAFSVKISDSGKYNSKAEKNKVLNEVIANAVDIMDKHGEKINCDYSIIVNDYGRYEFNTSSENSRLRFLRDCYGLTSVSDLSEEQKASSASDVVKYLSSEEVYGIDSKYSRETVIYILNFRSYMSANTYQRSMEFTMSYDVNDETVAEILENSRTLIGVTVSEEYIRKYENGFYAAHILGYTGKISTDELTNLQAQNSQYAANDVVGKAGIEQSMELYLQGQKGERKVYVDNVGRITQVLEETEPVTGSDVYLTIDIELQKKIYNALEQEIAKILVSKITSDDKPYVYKADGTTISDILIPIKDVYFALIDNNVVSTSRIAQENTPTEVTVHTKFLSKQEEVLNRVRNELTISDTDYNKLSEEMQVYIYKIYEILLNDGVIIRANVDRNDSMYEQWNAETISLKEYLSYALAKNWIDVSKFTDSEYSSLTEAYDNLVEYIISEITDNNTFSKKIYKYMIKYRQLSGSEICVLLYDQGVLAYDEDSRGKLIMGKLSAQKFLTDKISSCEITPAQLALKPCSGSCVIVDNNTGRVQALVSYPSYDINNFSGTVDATYYNKLLNDGSLPLVNNATTTKTAPGSVFKIVSSIAGLETGVISTSEEMECTGIYETVTPNPKCWVYPGRHGDVNVSTALRDSCNVFFYEVGYRLAMTTSGDYSSEKGTNILGDYARKLGIGTNSGIEIYEATPTVSNDNAIFSAIGQGRHNYTCLNLARYVATIANSGVCYDLTLIDKIVDSSGNTVFSSVPIVASTMNDVSNSTWNAVHYGMKLVSENQKSMNKLTIPTGSKSGTAQENKRYPDHCTFIAYAPYDDPEIAISTVIQNGYASGNVAELTANILNIYYNIEQESISSSTEETPINGTN